MTQLLKTALDTVQDLIFEEAQKDVLLKCDAFCITAERKGESGNSTNTVKITVELNYPIR